MDAVERPQFRVVEETRAPLLRWPGAWGVLVWEGCPLVVPGCPPGTYPAEGSRCWVTEQVATVGIGASDS